jgi:hypothetical protein
MLKEQEKTPHKVGRFFYGRWGGGFLFYVKNIFPFLYEKYAFFFM